MRSLLQTLSCLSVLASGAAEAQPEPTQTTSITYCVVMVVDGFRYAMGCEQAKPDQIIAAGRPGVAPEVQLFGHQSDRPAPHSEEVSPRALYSAPPAPPARPIVRPPFEARPAASGNACGDPSVQAVLAYANQARQQSGLPSLGCDESLARAALQHSQDMCSRRYFSHMSPEGTSPAQRAARAGVSANLIGENIASGQRDAAEVHHGWMNSRGHRENILNPDYRQLGLGIVTCGGQPYWTQLFSN